jgi:hypothetical protein
VKIAGAPWRPDQAGFDSRSIFDGAPNSGPKKGIDTVSYFSPISTELHRTDLLLLRDGLNPPIQVILSTLSLTPISVGSSFLGAKPIGDEEVAKVPGLKECVSLDAGIIVGGQSAKVA